MIRKTALLLAILALLQPGVPSFAASPAASFDGGSPIAELDNNPLQRYVPPSNLFMPVPSGRLAVTTTADPSSTIEEQRESRRGGLVYGYCLTSSCSYVTHLVIAQVCGNRIGGKDGSEKLILGVAKLPFGGRPGYLHTLQGQNYAENFLLYGPSEKMILAEEGEESRLYALTVKGMGPVAPIRYDGMEPSNEQPPETLAVRLTRIARQGRSSDLPRFEVRHFCKVPLS